MKKEYGRSMVEMLGTLAIIGVLSVTALVGYKIAMTKNRTNNILYDVNLAMNEIATREYMSLPVDEEAPVSDLGVKSEFDIGYARLGGEEKNGFYIAVDGITPEVCETLRSNKTAFMAEIQPYNGEEPANSCEDANAVLMKFPYPPIEGGEVVPTTVPITCRSWEEVVDGYCCNKNCVKGEGDNRRCCCGEVCGTSCCESGYSCNEEEGLCYNEWGSSCPEGSVAYSDEYSNICCNAASEKVVTDDYEYYAHCCPKDSTGYAKGCCSSSTVPTYDGSFDYHCCPPDAVYSSMDGYCIYEVDGELVCENDLILNSSGSGYLCCSVDQYLKNGSCEPCPSGSTCDGSKITKCEDGYVLNTSSDSSGCCSTNQYFQNGWCVSCPSGATCDGTKITDCGRGKVFNTYSTYNACCSTNQYFEDGSCYTCPSGATCDGTANVICSDTTKYFKYPSCRSCPSGATCDGTKITDCGSGEALNTYSTYNVCCPTHLYFRSGSCNFCPTNAVCNGTANVICSKTSMYFNGLYCLSCPSGATCDGTSTVTCTSGTWNGSSCS